MNQQSIADFPDIVVEMVAVGIFAMDRRMNIILWNRFMEIHSQLRANEVLGKNLFDCFPELSRKWLEKKLRTIMVLKSQSFTSWKERPYLLKFPNVHSMSNDAEFMYQACSFWPLKDKSNLVRGVCISIHDVTETAVTQRLLEKATEQALTLEETSQRDSLTGLYNRYFFDEQISQEIARARRYQWNMGLIMLDIDHFKKVNDTYGHPGGDEVLRVVAFTLLKQLRSSDILCRYGGEEFAMILPQVNEEKGRYVADRLRTSIEEANIDFEGQNIKVTISMGFSLLRDDMTPGQLIGEADSALYMSKNSGRNCVTCFSPDQCPEPNLLLT